jgi:hypothetical protein
VGGLPLAPLDLGEVIDVVDVAELAEPGRSASLRSSSRTASSRLPGSSSMPAAWRSASLISYTLAEFGSPVVFGKPADL